SAYLGAFNSARRAVHRLSRSKVILWIRTKFDEEYELSESAEVSSSSERIDPDTRDQSTIEEMYAPSTEDIEVASWILSTSMDPSALRAAAASLPYLHVPSVLTTKHLDPAAISRLLFLFQDANKACLGPDIPPSEALSDLAVYGEALLHVLLSSVIEETVQSGSLRPGWLPWWTSYIRSMGLLSNHFNNIPELQNNQEFTMHCLQYNFPLWGCTPILNPEKMPLHVAALIYSFISSGKSGLEGVLARLLVEDTKETVIDKKNTDIPPWNVVNMAALALKILPDGHDHAGLELEAQVKDIRAIWDAYTDDGNLFSNFANACRVYKERVRAGGKEMDHVYKWLCHSMWAIVEHTNGLGDSCDQVAQWSIGVAVIGLSQYSQNEADENILAMAHDCLCIAAKDPKQIPFDAVTPLWPFILDKDTPSNMLEVALEGVLGISKFQSYPEQPQDDYNNVIDSEHMGRLLNLLKDLQETLCLLALQLLRNGVYRDTVDMILCDDFIPLIMGQLMRDASTCEKDMFDAISSLLYKVVMLLWLHNSQQKIHTLAHAIVGQAASTQPINIRVVAIAVNCWDHLYTWECHSEQAQQPVSDSEDAKGTAHDPIWFSDTMINAISEYLEATSGPRESQHYSVLYTAEPLEQYYGKVDNSTAEGALNLDPATLSRFKEAYKQWGDDGSKDGEVHDSEPEVIDIAWQELEQEDSDDQVSPPPVTHTSNPENLALEFALDY
ncbi:hypothetical protein FRB99_001630, partial [Tulasnella sp. 403]